MRIASWREWAFVADLLALRMARRMGKGAPPVIGFGRDLSAPCPSKASVMGTALKGWRIFEGLRERLCPSY